ncbi:MAG TPA: 2-C-methyl-D-erythritol 2,4-cyclodiphosphate synthase [Bacteroidota bacterium]|nr:2-C-methyl-D-erythritol 2,4-cyclodiphosphate synthase [Bacteroidota bacterium]
MRVGYGYDVHRLTKGRKLVLGGVDIPAEKGLDGHSDADVLLHAIMDALAGAAALGDIGQHFPNTDERYRGISSMQLLRLIAGLLERDRFAVINVDSTIVLEVPKVGPHIEAMRKNIAEALAISPSCVSIKATTSEGMGFVGRGEGAAAHAVALVRKRD